MIDSTARFRTLIGTRLPGGASWSTEGTNFSVYSQDARNMELRLYETGESTEPFQVIALDPNTQRTFFAWHVFVERLPVGTHYTWRVQRKDDSWWEVLDPWARAVSDKDWDRRQPISPTNGLRGIVTDTRYEWSEAAFTPRPLDDAVIYEVHVGGYTRHSVFRYATSGHLRRLDRENPLS